uniref:Tripartite motif-containing protein 5 n=1 Tax=Aotus nancymaae TaxID=37293 RepID=A0A2K5DEK1_AOTNA
MASRILVNIKEEVTCPICLELLTEPLSLDCGHSFCQACITANHNKSMPHQGERSCPLCRISYSSENLRPNRHLANIVERLREVTLSPEEGQKVDHCAHHGEKLVLFCQQDGNVICWLCERSQEHRGHQTFLVEEVAQTYREKLQVALEMMRQKQKDAEKLEADVREEQASWKIQIQNDKTNIMAEFKKRRDILDCEESKELQNLEKEEKNILKRLVQSENDMVLQTQSVRVLISDLEHRLQGSVMELLQVRSGKKADRSPTLPGHPSCTVISEDERQVRYQKRIYQPFLKVRYFCGVLGSPSITSGKHYWEVDVSNKSEWILGVCVSLKRTASCSVPRIENYQPKNGSWVIGLRNADNYSAFQDAVEYSDFQDGSCSTPSAPLIVPLFMTICPNRVGVFLDYEACTVSFFNVTNNGFLIYKFSNCHFCYPVFPYFSPMTCELPMTLCSPSS